MRAGVDHGYYARLEQGRAHNPSSEVLSSISRALNLTDAETDYLFQLAGRARPPRSRPFPAEVPSSVRGILDSLVTSPAYLMDRYWDLVGWNAALAAVFGDPGLHPSERRNVLLLMLLAADQRQSIEDWEGNAIRMLRQFARDAATEPGGRFAAVIDELTANSPEFRQWWPRYDVVLRAQATGAVTPAGLDRPIQLDQTTWQLASAPSLRLVIYRPATAADEDGVRASLRLRAVEPDRP